jgi:hypothetical protein
MWFTLHTMAARATSDSLKRAFVTYITTLARIFPCIKCRSHFVEFIDKHPLVNYWQRKSSKGDDIGMFMWTWELHNEVNQRLGKPRPSLEAAYHYYQQQEGFACQNCGSDKKSPPAPPPATNNALPAASGEFKIIPRY